MANNEAIPFQMSDLKTRVTDTIKANFGMLIPDDKFAEMVNAEIKAFFETSDSPLTITNTNGYHSQSEIRAKCTPFRVLVWEQIVKIAGNKIQEVLNSETFRAGMSYGDDSTLQAQMSAEMQTILEGMIPRMMAQVMKNTFSTMVQNAKEEVMRGFGR